MTKNIVICCDGTGNNIEKNQTNVFRFFRMLEKNSKQRVKYITGVGTIGYSDPYQKIYQSFQAFIGLTFGAGFDKIVLEAYEFVCENYENGDKIWLFGFSRGAYAMQTLSALIYVVGLMPKDQINLAGHAFTTFKNSSVQVGKKFGEQVDCKKELTAQHLETAYKFRNEIDCIYADIEFMGLWDPVGSVIVPDKFLLSLDQVRFSNRNPIVKAVRIAASIDERRRMFRLHDWHPEKKLDPDQSGPHAGVDQDFEKVWFSGVHSDVGGGYSTEMDLGHSLHPLAWMVSQSENKDLQFNKKIRDQILSDRPDPKTEEWRAPNDSVLGAWPAFEYWPKSVTRREWPDRKSFFGFYLPRREPRVIPDGEKIHNTTAENKNYIELYCPINLNMAKMAVVKD